MADLAAKAITVGLAALPTQKIKNVYQFKARVSKLKDALNELKAYHLDIQNRIDNKVLQCSLQVAMIWLREVKSALKDGADLVGKIDREKHSECARMLYAQEAYEMLVRVNKLNEKTFDSTTTQKELPRDRMTLPRHFVHLEWYKEVIKKLMDERLLLVGIVGGRGSGMSTFVRYLSHKLCDEYSCVLFISSTSEDEIQQEIGRKLNLVDSSWDKNNRTERGALINRALRKREFALIFEELPASVSLQDIGVALAEPRTKVVFGTHSERVCYYMEADETFKMGTISHTDAFRLLYEKVYKDHRETFNQNFNIAGVTNVAVACRQNVNLVALVGMALRNKTEDTDAWRDAVMALGAITEVILENKEEAKQLFAHACKNGHCNLFQLTPEMEQL